jgi:hypothetical protein
MGACSKSSLQLREQRWELNLVRRTLSNVQLRCAFEICRILHQLPKSRLVACTENLSLSAVVVKPAKNGV